MPLALQSLLILKVPDAGLFAAYFLANQIIATLQHSELPWGFRLVRPMGSHLAANPSNSPFDR